MQENKSIFHYSKTKFGECEKKYRKWLKTPKKCLCVHQSNLINVKNKHKCQQCFIDKINEIPIYYHVFYEMILTVSKEKKWDIHSLLYISNF